MGDRDDEIVRLLTEIRDNQVEDLDYRRQVMEQSLALQRRAVRWQRVGLVIVFVVIACGAALIALLWLPMFIRRWG